MHNAIFVVDGLATCNAVARFRIGSAALERRMKRAEGRLQKSWPDLRSSH